MPVTYLLVLGILGVILESDFGWVAVVVLAALWIKSPHIFEKVETRPFTLYKQTSFQVVIGRKDNEALPHPKLFHLDGSI